MLKLRDIERRSYRPFGKSTSKGRFHLEINKLPVYNIPDLKDFPVF